MILGEFIGNRHIVKTVQNMFRCNRIPHAIIIEGEKGFGKHTMAGIIAAGAVCGEDNPPCGVCRDCCMAEKSAHPDISVTLPDGAGIKVDQIRALRQEAYIMPNQAGRRVFIIDHADSMNESASNALLKVLEEPPEHAMFILIAESSASLLTTIVSRSVTLSLAPVEQDAAVRFIMEKGGHPEDRVASAVAVSGGNIGFAMSLLEENSAEWELTDSILRAAESGSELELLRLFYSLEGKKSRERVNIVLAGLRDKLERLISDKAAGRKAVADAAGSGIPMKKLMKMLSATEAAAEQNRGNAGISLMLTNLSACFKAPLDV